MPIAPRPAIIRNRRRQSKRKLLVESLENRLLLAVDSLSPYSPDAPASEIDGNGEFESSQAAADPSLMGPVDIREFAQTPKLFSAADDSSQSFANQSYESSVARSSVVEVQFDTLGFGGSPTESLKLNLFDDTEYTAVFDRAETTTLGSQAWIGHVKGVDHSQVILSVTNGMLAGSISMPGGIYQISPIDETLHSVQQIDQSQFPSELPPIELPESESSLLDSTESSVEVSGDDPADIITVLVPYSPQARSAAGGVSQIEAHIALAVLETNQSYENSGIAHRLELVHTMETSGSDATNNFSTDLGALQNLNDGVFDDVDAARETYFADLVGLIVENSSSCGLGYVNSSAAFAFSVTHRTCATGNYSFGHELGHNMGARHDWFVDDSANYHKGFVNVADNWRTVMAYNNKAASQGTFSTRLPYWSNPEVTFGNPPDPMGVVSTGPMNCVEGATSPDSSTCAADNRLRLNERALTVANFRDSPDVVEAEGPYFLVDTTLDQLISVDEVGALAVVGPFNADVDSLAYDSQDDILYGLETDGPDGIYTIDRATGAATLLGSLPISVSSAITYNPLDDLLYSVTDIGELVQINPDTLTATIVTTPGSGVGGAGLAYNPIDQRIYVQTNVAPFVYSYDAATLAGPVNHSAPSTAPFFGMAFNGTSLVLSDGPDADQNIYSYDPATGTTTPLFATDFLDGLLIDGMTFRSTPPAEILGQKWNDADGDGMRDPGELGLNNWVIELYDDQNVLVGTQTTADVDLDDNGQIDPETERGIYRFSNLAEGTYTVREVQQPGWTQTSPGFNPFTQDFESGLGPNEIIAGSFIINNTNATLNNGTSMMGHPGVYGNNEYSYYEVILDLNGLSGSRLEFDYAAHIENGWDGVNVQASTSPISPPFDLIVPTSGLPYDGSFITIPELGSSTYDSNGVLDTGLAVFDLSPFDGQIVRVRVQFGSDSSVTRPGINIDNLRVLADGAGAHTVVLAAGDVATGADFGNHSAGPLDAEIHGQKWNDLDGDGERDPGEPGLNGWVIELYDDQDSLIATQTTADVDIDNNGQIDPETERGLYAFTGLPAGTYSVGEVLQPGWVQTSPGSVTSSLIGLYDFENGTAENQVSGAGALPNLVVSGVSISGGDAVLDATSDYLELPQALGQTPFTFYMDASFDAFLTTPNFVVSQAANSLNAEDVDFTIQQTPTTQNNAIFYDAAGAFTQLANGNFDGSRHRIALTWDGTTLGNFYDGTLLTTAVTGTVPDIDATVLRIGDRILNDSTGSTGVVHEIQIFDRALSESELAGLAAADPVVEADVAPAMEADVAPAVKSQKAAANPPAYQLDVTTALADSFYFPPQSRLFESGGYLSAPSDDEPLEIALDFLSSNAADLGLDPDDLKNVLITDQYVSSHTGVTHIHLRQTYGGLEITGADININITADGQVLNVGSTFLGGLDPATAPASPQVSLSAVEALQSLAADIGATYEATPWVYDLGSGAERSMWLPASGVSLAPVPANLHYVPTPDGVELAWNLTVETLDRQHWLDSSVSVDDGELIYVSDWIDNATYNVYALPIEDPDDGVRTLEVDPQELVASPFGWHDTNGVAGAEFTDTRGNNVFAQEDTDANNTGGFRPDGGASLIFDFPLNLANAPSSYQEAAITNLFYWNNILHDIHYQYGFDEVSGNFQENNYGRGGLGGDAVQADAQDGSSINNANFGTPPDGSNPRMQQFIFNLTTPNRDSDLSNEIIIHEYGHGVSNRLTGGPANSGALNAVQSGGMGEGWSDFHSLMLTQTATDAQLDAYPVGTYVLGETKNGTGIRRQPYSFDMAINPQTYGSFNSSSQVHNAGEIWASVLWDLNWLLINGDGAGSPVLGFNSDFYNGNGGNNLALQLVMDGMKLQPANPSFLDGRDGILAADQALTGGLYQTVIWTAFARRGMGFSADDGGSGNATTVVEAFDMPATSTGLIEFDDDTYRITDDVTVTVRDTDLIGGGPIAVTVVSSGGDTETVTLSELGSGIFRGVIATSDTGAPGDGTLNVQPGDIITATYNDADDGTGNPATVNDTADIVAFPTSIVLNGSFETGDFTDWTVQVVGTPLEPWTVSGAGAGSGFGMQTTTPQDGSFVAWNGFDGSTAVTEFTMHQDVTLPANSTATLSWLERVQWDFTYAGSNTGLIARTHEVELRDPTTNALLETLYTFSTGTQAQNPTGDTGWTPQSVDVSSHAGSTVRLVFRQFIPESLTGPGQIELDDIQIDAEATGGPSARHTVVLAASEIVTGIDFGNHQLGGEIHGQKWNDLNGDGVRDVGEPGLNGWVIELYDDQDVLVATQVTADVDLDDNGQIDPETERGLYAFTGLAAGSYTVSEVMQTGWEQTSPGAGGGFRLLGGTGSAGNPFSLVELQTSPVAEALIGPSSFNPAMDIDPTSGILYGASSTLRTVDSTTGLATTIGSIDSSSETGILVQSIAFAPDGSLYGTADDVLYSIDKTSGFATEIGTISTPSWGIDFAPDGTMYGGYFDLYTIDPATAQIVTNISTLSATVLDIDFAPDGFIYGVNANDSSLHQIDPATGSMTLIGNYVSDLWGVASEPLASALPGSPLVDGDGQVDNDAALRDQQALRALLAGSAVVTAGGQPAGSSAGNFGTANAVAAFTHGVTIAAGEVVNGIDFGNHLLGNQPPTITSSASVNAPENQTFVIDVQSTDPNGDTEGSGLTYSLTGNVDDTLFSIVPGTGVLTFNSAPDFENPIDAGGDGTYDVQVTVTDSGGLTDVQDLQVTVTDVFESPTITSPPTASVPENQTFVIDVQSTDSDGEVEGAGLTYSLTGNVDDAQFSIVPGTGVLSFNTAPDFENPTDAGANNVYDVQVTVTDTGGRTDVQNLQVTVTNVNEAPTITTPAAVSIPEETTFVLDVDSFDPEGEQESSGLVYSLTGNVDDALFSINSNSGTLFFVSAPDFENPGDVGGDNVYDIEITVTDSGSLTGVQNLQVTVTDNQGELSGQKWNDLDGDGVRDPGEPGLNGWVIELYDHQGGLVGTRTTADVDLDSSGQIDPETERGLYAFDDLAEGIYTLLEVPQAGWVQTSPGQVTQFVSSGAGGLDVPRDVTQLDSGDLVVSAGGSLDQVLRYDGVTGAFIDAFIPSILEPSSLSVGPDETGDGVPDLYVLSNGGQTGPAELIRYDGETGDLDGVLMSDADTPLVSDIVSFAFSEDGFVYTVDNGVPGEIVRWDASTGDFDSIFVARGASPLNQAGALTFGPGGDLYVSVFNENTVLRYDGSNGAFKSTFVAAGAGGLDGPADLAFGSDLNLYVVSSATDSVLRYDGTTGAFLGVAMEDPGIGFLYGIEVLGTTVYATGLTTDSVWSVGSDGPNAVFLPHNQSISGLDFGNQDIAAPSTISFTRQTPTDAHTNADTLVFLATFSEDVQGVDAADFAVTGTTGSLAVAQLTGSTYEVTISGGDLAGLNASVGLNFNSPSITDLSGNPLPATEPAIDESYVVDNTEPVTLLTFPVDGQTYNAATWTDSIAGTASDSGGADLDEVQLSIQRHSDNLYWSGSAFDSASEVLHVATGTTNWSLPLADSNLTDSVQYTVRASATDTAGNVENTAVATFAYDTSAPKVVDVIAGSSSWSANFIDAVDGDGIGAGNGLGLSLVGPGQLDAIPWDSVDRLHMRFSEDVLATLGIADVAVVGTDAGSVTISPLQYPAANHTVTIPFSSALLRDRFVVSLSADGIQDAAGNRLDGEWTSLQETPSGDDTAGGQFDFFFNVLVGDANGNGSVNVVDLPLFSASFNRSVGSETYNPRVDWNADESVNVIDLPYFSGSFNRSLPLVGPPIPSFGQSDAPQASTKAVDAVFAAYDDDLTTEPVMEQPSLATGLEQESVGGLE